eukprot:773598-Pyramimonas_sp.AAC.1
MERRVPRKKMEPLPGKCAAKRPRIVDPDEKEEEAAGDDDDNFSDFEEDHLGDHLSGVNRLRNHLLSELGLLRWDPPPGLEHLAMEGST